jgi:WD40 repeat protein
MRLAARRWRRIPGMRSCMSATPTVRAHCASLCLTGRLLCLGLVVFGFEEKQTFMLTSAGVVTMWSPNMSAPLVRMLCHSSAVTALGCSYNGQHMVTAGLDGDMKVWDLRKNKVMDVRCLSLCLCLLVSFNLRSHDRPTPSMAQSRRSLSRSGGWWLWAVVHARLYGRMFL